MRHPACPQAAKIPKVEKRREVPPGSDSDDSTYIPSGSGDSKSDSNSDPESEAIEDSDDSELDDIEDILRRSLLLRFLAHSSVSAVI